MLLLTKLLSPDRMRQQKGSCHHSKKKKKMLPHGTTSMSERKLSSQADLLWSGIRLKLGGCHRTGCCFSHGLSLGLQIQHFPSSFQLLLRSHTSSKKY